MNKLADVAGIVLAGGLSSRIGEDKGQLTLDGEPLAKRALKTMSTLFKELIYVTNDPMTAPAYPGIKLAKDEVPHLGPLGGILAGLKISKAPRAFVVGYDMPFVSLELAGFLVGYDLTADIVVPKTGGRYEPLHAVYSRACIPVIADQLAAGNRRVIGFYDKVKVVAVDEPELRRIDPELLSFFNINTADDLKRAAELLEEAR